MTTSPSQAAAPFKGQYRTVPEPSARMPPGIPYIVANEFAERFSFYGMSAILVVFMTHHLKGAAGQLDLMREDDAEIWYHTFTLFVYFTPIIGALIADIFWGKYNTIIWVSLLYCFGHGVLAMGETRTHLAIGLTLIGLGAGGIKPCVSAHVGDQFGKTNEHLLSKVYNWFYFSINLGAFISMLCTPYLLEHHGPRLAFGVPGILMALAALVFWLGRFKFVHRPAQGWGEVKDNFTGDNLKILLRLIVFFLLVAPFYAAYYQNGGAWVAQAEHLDLNLHVLGITLLQGQVQSTNGILVLVFIPLFTYGVYPMIDRFFKLTPHRKMSLGIFTLIPAFMIIAWLEGRIVVGQTPSVWWQILAYAILTAAEVMVSVPALEFAYTQAPEKMKSVIMAAYLAGSISLGNLIARALIEYFKKDWIAPYVRGKNHANYYWIFVGLLVAAGLVFTVVASLMPTKDFVADESTV